MTYKAGSIVRQKREQMKMSKLLGILDFNSKLFKDFKSHKNEQWYLIKLHIYLVYLNLAYVLLHGHFDIKLSFLIKSKYFRKKILFT